MKANELRIWNYVYHDALKIPRLGLEGMDYMQITGEGISCFEQKLMDVRPIPLTEEWLLKFGFYMYRTKTNTGFDLGGNFIRVTISNKNKILKVVLMNNHIFHVKHVHQLQNLYFAFTNSELTTKEL